MKDLNEVPLPEIGLIDSDFYRRKKKPCAVVVASRGCPLKCSYCSIGCAEWSRFRLKSTERVLDELEAVIHSGARFIDFEDENISFNREWFLELLAGISERLSGIDVEFRAMNGLFPPTIDREVVGAMKRAGFTALNLSLCTTCREQLKTFRRPDVREAFENALELSAEYGMDCVGYIIAGALGQRAEDSVADLLYLADKKVVAGVSIFYPAPGSSEFLKCRNRKILPQKNSLLRATTLPVEDTTTRVEAATLLRLGRLLNFLKSLEPEEIKEVFSPDLRAGIDSMPLDARNFAQKDDLNRRIQELAQTAASAGKSARHGESPLPTRREIGKLLLSSFLRDGVLLGIDPARKVFEHKVSHSLCKLLRDGLLQLFTQNNPQL